MAEISKITLPSGVTYDIKDATAREFIASGTSFLGITTTALTDGATTATIKIGTKDVAAVNGGIAIYGNGEFIYSTSDNKWHEIGDTTNLGALAYVDTASASYKPAGTVSKPTFTGNALTSTGSVTAEGTVSQPTFTGTPMAVFVEETPAGSISSSTSGTANYTPAGTVTQPTFTGNSLTSTGKFTPAGSISTGTGTANYTPAGSVSTPTITVTPNTVSKYVAASATGGGSVTAGSAAACTLPTLSMSVANENLTLDWTAGSFTANTPTAVTLPTFASQTIATGIKSATSTKPTFTGTQATITVQPDT